MRKLLIISLLISWIGLTAQENKTYFFPTDAYSSIVSGKRINITIVNSDSCYVWVRSKNYLPKKFSYSINNGVLNLQAKGLKNSSIDVECGAPEFKEIYMSGAGDMSSTNVIKGKSLYLELSGASSAKLNMDYKQLKAKLSGASDAIISGKVDSLYVKSSGASDLDAFKAKNIYASVQASGASDVNLNTDSIIVADLSGASSLKYKKDPKYKNINSNESVWVENNHPGIYVSEDKDTVKMKIGRKNSQIIIIDKGDSVRVNAEEWEEDHSFKGNWSGVELGMNAYLTPGNSINMDKKYQYMELKYEKSFNFNINFFQQSFNIIGEHFGVLTGMGLQWYNYRFSNNTILTNDSNKIGGYYNTDTKRTYSKSKLTASYLVIPILFEYQTNPFHNTNSFHISAGVIGGVRLSSHSKQVYKTGNSTNKPKVYDSFYLQPFRLDATARIGWGPLNIYANYSIIRMFRKGRGPQLYPFTVGLILPFT